MSTRSEPIKVGCRRGAKLVASAGKLVETEGTTTKRDRNRSRARVFFFVLLAATAAVVVVVGPT